MVDVASADNDHVVTIVVSGMEISKMVDWDAVEIVSITFARLTHHMLSEDIEMNIFYQGFLVVFEILLMLLMDLFF
jgi:hypothetical protein